MRHRARRHANAKQHKEGNAAAGMTVDGSSSTMKGLYGLPAVCHSPCESLTSIIHDRNVAIDPDDAFL